MWTILKVFMYFVTILLLIYVFGIFFGLEAFGILAFQPGIEPIPLALKGEVLTTEPPGKSQYAVILKPKMILPWQYHRCLHPHGCLQVYNTSHCKTYLSEECKGLACYHQGWDRDRNNHTVLYLGAYCTPGRKISWFLIIWNILFVEAKLATFCAITIYSSFKNTSTHNYFIILIHFNLFSVLYFDMV